MKKIALITVLLISSTTWACPNFSGNYKCEATYSDGTAESYDMSVSQQGNVFTTTDSEGSAVIVADGVPRELDLGFMTTVSCVGNSIEVVMTGSIPENNQGPLIIINALTTITPQGSRVVMETNTNVKVPAHGHEEDQKSNTTCQKK